MPRGIEGRTIGEAGLRSRFGVSVLAVKRMGRDGLERRFVPGPAERFLHGDVLIVLGTDESLARLHDDRALPVTRRHEGARARRDALPVLS